MHPFVSLSIPFDFQDLYQPIQSNNDEITAVELNQKDDSPITKEGMRGHLIRIICGNIFHNFYYLLKLYIQLLLYFSNYPKISTHVFKENAELLGVRGRHREKTRYDEGNNQLVDYR